MDECRPTNPFHCRTCAPFPPDEVQEKWSSLRLGPLITMPLPLIGRQNCENISTSPEPWPPPPDVWSECPMSRPGCRSYLIRNYLNLPTTNFWCIVMQAEGRGFGDFGLKAGRKHPLFLKSDSEWDCAPDWGSGLDWNLQKADFLSAGRQSRRSRSHRSCLEKSNRRTSRAFSSRKTLAIREKTQKVPN